MANEYDDGTNGCGRFIWLYLSSDIAGITPFFLLID